MKDSSSILRALLTLLTECADQCSTDASRDVRRINERYEHEGLSFLTISLSNFCSDFFQSLERSEITSDLFIGWKKRACLPTFLSGFTSLCFDANSGRILDEPHIHAIRSVRQVCSFVKKIKLDCTPERQYKAFQRYVRTDSDLSSDFLSLSLDERGRFRQIARLVTSELIGDEIDMNNIIPHHGPGSTSEKLTGNAKYAFLAGFPERLRPWFDESLFFNSDESYHHSDVEVTCIPECNELPVRVISVQKTLKTPRIIAMEPVAMQMVQQGLKDFLVDKIENSSLTKGHINFSDQSVNKTLALSSSSSRHLATLDLEEASDRVHNEFVKDLFSVNPDFSMLTQACRSRIAKLPDGSILELEKFASMGSALCFPVEALFFFTLLVMTGLKHKGLPVTSHNIFIVSREIYVYGDDIIIPVEQVESAITLFAAFGCRVSKTKSFFRGCFRESCGMDAYNGFDITPIYLRNPIPSRKCEAAELVSLISTVNQLYKADYHVTANLLKDEVEGVLGKLPTVSEESAGLGWCFGEPSRGRFNKFSQNVEVKTFSLYVRLKDDGIDGYAALAKCLLSLELPKRIGYVDETLPMTQAKSSDTKHLERTPRRGALTLKHRWIAR